MYQTYENFKKENRLRLFGHEDAGKESEERLCSYYHRTTQYEDIMSSIKLQIITGEKGTGKSALLRMAYLNGDDREVPIWVRLDDLSELYNEILKSDNLYELKTLWKKSISRLVIMKLAENMSFVLGDDYEKAIHWAYEYGYASRDFIAQAAKILKPMYEKYIRDDSFDDNSKGELRILERMLQKRAVRLYFDDFDLDWKGKGSDVIRIKSLLLSLSDMTSEDRKSVV